MKDSFGNALTLTLFGESHGQAVGCTVDGLAAGIAVDEAFMRAQMERRRAKGAISTARHEADEVQFLSGVLNGCTTGSALTLTIANTNTRGGDYSRTQQLLRPGHADYTAAVKYGGYADVRGGGHFSGRLTAPLVAGCSVLQHLLAQRGITVVTRIAEIAGIADDAFSSDASVFAQQVQRLSGKDFAVLNDAAGEQMQANITEAAAEGDSVGGVLETVILGLPAGLGEPFFTSAESEIAALMFSIPAVKGIAFGAGFSFAALRGSEANDAFCMDGTRIITKTNRNGGINGGITNGMPVVFRTVIKPTPSIFKPQGTVDYLAKQNAVLQLQGRHDPCIVHRAAVVQESLAAFAIADLCTVRYGKQWQEAAVWNMD